MLNISFSFMSQYSYFPNRFNFVDLWLYFSCIVTSMASESKRNILWNFLCICLWVLLLFACFHISSYMKYIIFHISFSYIFQNATLMLIWYGEYLHNNSSTLITNLVLIRHNINCFSLCIYLLLLESSLEQDYLFAKINNMLQVAFTGLYTNFNELKHNQKVFIILCQQSTNHKLKTDIGADSLLL